MKASRLNWFAAVGVLLALTAPARAQPSFHHEISVEAMVLNADAVVVGKVVEVAEGKEFHEVTIAVEETLRGEHHARQRIRFFGSIWQLGVGAYDGPDLIKVKNDGYRLLVAIHQEEEKPALVCGLIFLAGPEMRVRKADLTVLRKPADVLVTVKETIRRAPGVKRIDTFPLTVPTKGGYYFGRGGSTTVAVPVDDLLEKRLLESIRSPERWQRTEGAHGLRYFKSDDNIARVKALLQDAEPYISSEAEHNKGIEVRKYTVREAAFATLKYWGVDAEKPIVNETITKLDVVRRVSFAGAEVTVAEIKNLDRFKNLQELDLTAAKLTDEDLKELACFTNLQGLSLERTKVTDVSLRQLAALKNLRSLQLGYCKVTDAGLKELAGLDKLEVLWLQDNKIADAGLKELAGLQNLRELWLEKTKITDAGLKELTGLKKLAVLDVSETNVTAAGLKDLAGCKNLTTLNLSYNQVTDRTLQALRQLGMLHVLAQAGAKRRPDQLGYENAPSAKSAAEVDTLNLGWTQVTDTGLKELAALVNLDRLYLMETKVTDAGLAPLRKALPKCVIIR